MKRFILFAMIAMFGTVSVLYSQTGRLARHDSKVFSYGIRAGISSANLSGDIQNAETKIGYTIGAFGMAKLGQHIGISADILYSQQGCNFPDSIFGKDTITGRGYTLNYLNVPLLANWYIPGAPGLTVKAGLQAGFLLSSKTKTGDVSVDGSDVFNSIDLAIPLGISYELHFGLLLEVRYNIGLFNVWNSDKTETLPEDASIKNSALQVTFGYRF